MAVVILFIILPVSISCDKNIYNGLFEKFLSLNYIIPDSGKEGLVITINDLHGELFMAGATVKLIRSGYSDIIASSVILISQQQLTCQLDLNGAAEGKWSVVVTNSDGYTAILQDGFTVSLHTVTYLGNGHSSGNPPAGSPFGYYVGATVTVSGNTGDFRGPLIQDGITQRFVEWNTAANGTGTAYVPGDTFSMGISDVILYAQWTTDSSVITKIGPAGGYVFYEDIGDVFPTWQYMEASPEDVGGTGMRYVWGCEGTLISGASGTAIGDGPANTTDILNGCISGEVTAAEACDAYTLNGYTDWFLPSHDELQELHTQLYGQPFITNFDTWDYWSSNQFNAISAYCYHFAGDTFIVGSKGTSMATRAVRRF